jgi:antitoxin component of MazEF toxin-antitoxin module
MPLIKKIIRVGNSKAITIPPSWLEFIEKQTGETIRELAMEVNGSLKIRPILKEPSDPTEKVKVQNTSNCEKVKRQQIAISAIQKTTLQTGGQQHVQ